MKKLSVLLPTINLLTGISGSHLLGVYSKRKAEYVYSYNQIIFKHYIL